MEVYEDLELTGEVTDEAYERLENELHITKQRLQSVTEEHETSEEEMRASHEEVQSVNEELRSTLEELETSKEELQSINEELITVNQENRNKVEELSQLSNDLQNLLSATDIATLFLDRNLRIMRYTPKLGELFNVKPTDRGRSLSDFTHRLGYDGFVADAREVLNNLQYKEQEVQSQDGLWFLMRILPYRTEQDRIEGVVITFVEISQVKNAEQNLREALRDLEKQQEKLRALNETLEERVAERTREVRTLAQTLTEAEQAERGRIAQILHDDLQQILCAIQTKFYLIQADLNKLEESESVEDFSEVQDWLQQGIDMTRQLTVELNPPVLKNEGMVAVLNWLANQVQSMHKLRVSVTSRTGEISLPEKTRILIFQVVRELLLNVVKHADVEEAEIICDHKDDQVIVKVVDNGCGFDLQDMDSESREGSGFGLQSIRERLRFFGGDLHIQSAPGEGSRMKILAPGNGNS
jgi:two-component system CheB/CheR fusion protein